jgi:hypothetical protein
MVLGFYKCNIQNFSYVLLVIMKTYYIAFITCVAYTVSVRDNYINIDIQ